MCGGVKRFHSYLFGRLFTLVTDHKPLVSLFEERRAIPAHASVRIQRWALTLMAYQYVLGLRTSAQNAKVMEEVTYIQLHSSQHLYYHWD